MSRLGSHRARPTLNLQGAFIRRTDLSGADLRDADLSGVDATGARFRDSDFAGARLADMILGGADLTGARNLTVDQIAEAIIDDQTRLPAYIDRHELIRRRKIAAEGEA
ncbi:pentapeptide repeat-containing protein [Methylobacterium sp. NEAU 140]|uniref:pentapeptide repeat-containing protein n=1 Tax=Methylobacterium sp. NEAU 140 TaxID=3064945 RepID=UPI002733A774|nr:pentapeptide repeat-containing protein [Methylobacterium sp. NEAU 140]MDP4023296.1 pentapeptide repeat-containing protein [Methylobacterium sp. NEAU 140]